MESSHKFICDRMLGNLCRYLRFMGYDTLSANDLPCGNPKEDTELLLLAESESRILLTRDTELSGRKKERALLISSEQIDEQLLQLLKAGLILPELSFTRCSICNTILRTPTDEEFKKCQQVPKKIGKNDCLWCENCKKLYWKGSHTDCLEKRISELHEKISNQS